MQHIGADFNVVYNEQRYRQGAASYALGQISTDGHGHAYVFLQFNRPVRQHFLIAWENGLGGEPSGDINEGTRLGIAQMASNGAAGAPEYGWVRIYGEGLFYSPNTLTESIRVYFGNALGWLQNSSSNSQNVLGWETIATTSAGTTGPAALNYPCLR